MYPSRTCVSVLAAMCLLGGAATGVSAQDVGVRAFLDRTEVGLNQVFVLSVEVSAPNANLNASVTLPDMDAFATFLGSSSSQQIQIINGRASGSRTLQYRFQATAEGIFEIRAMDVTVGGRTFETEPLRIAISQGVAAPPPSRGRPAPARGSADLPPEDLFLRATIDRTRVYQNEAVVVEYKIYTRVRVTSFSVTTPPSTPGFWAEDFPLPQSPTTGTEVFDGRQYTVATLKKMALFPTGVGEKTISPMSIQTEVRARGARDPFGDFFDLGSLFGRSIPKVITSEPLSVEVMPLPAVGRPPEFTGMVGDLAVSATIDKSEVETNEALTLRVTVEGQGNLRTLPEPRIDFPADFETYPPDLSEKMDRGGDRVGGRKTYEYVLIPRAPGRKTIPAIRLAYFNPRNEDYEVAASDPIDVVVTGEATTTPLVGAPGRGEVRALREDIRFIHTETPKFRRTDKPPLAVLPLILTVVLPLAVIGASLAGRRHLDRIQGDQAYARGRRATRVARKRLSAARASVQQGRSREFYAETGNALIGFLGDKLNIAEAGFIKDEVRVELEGRGVSDRVAADYFQCLDHCDLKRFSPSDAGVEEMRAFLKRAEGAMSELDREL